MRYYLFALFILIVTTLRAQVTDIVVVFKMHVDIGYTNWAEGVLQKYCNDMLTETLKSIDETSELPESEQFVWTIPAWPLKYMLENCSVDKKERLEKAIRDERIIPHALPVTFETEASDLENLVRGLTYASDLNRAYGLPQARDAKLTDVPSHSRVLPTVLKNAGVDFLHIGCNPGSMSPDVPTLFWWQGPDGARLLTFYWAEYYGSGILPPEGWPHKTWLAMIHTHENSGAPTPEEVAELLKTAKEKMPDVHIKIGRLSDFYDLLMKEDPQLPTVTGDMPDTWIHGYMSMPVETRLSKHLQRETYNAEMLNTQMNQWGMSDHNIDSYIEKAVENMILYDEHTFGAAMTHADQHKWTYNDEFRINKSLGHYDYLEGTWREKGNRIRGAEKIIAPLMKHQLKQLASSVHMDGKRVVVYNPLPWARSGRVNFFAGVYQKKFKIYGLKDAITGKVIPVYEDYNLISFDADSVPSMGYKTYIPVLEPINIETSLSIDERNNYLENKYFKLQIDRLKGTLSSVVDKQHNRELVSQNSDEGFGEYILERPGQKTNHLLDNYGWCCEKFAGTGAVYGEYYVSGTTLINDTLYKIINDTYYFHEDTLTKQVWYLNKEEKEVIYDFSLELNDTFKIELYGTIIGSYLVSDIDTIETLSGDRKRWLLYLTDSITIEDGTLTRDLIWIEGIGSTYGPVYPGTIPVENEFGGWGTCLEAVYSVDRDQIYQGYCTYIGGYWPDECKFISNRIDHATIDPVSAYFNAVGDLEINTGGRIDQLCIYDLSGRLVYSCLNNLAEQHLTIPNHLPTGIYICELFSETNERFSIKVIKNFASKQ